jgi:hypothetical protein
MRYTGGRLPLLNPHSMLHAIAAKRKLSPYKLPTPITTKTMLECLSYSMVSPQHCSLTREPASTCSLYMYTRKSNYRVPSRSLRPHVSTHTAAANLSVEVEIHMKKVPPLLCTPLHAWQFTYERR